MPTFAVDPSGRRVYPEWSFFFVVLHRRGTLGTFSKGTHCGRCPSSPSRMFGSLLVPWWIGLPLDQVHICCPSGLGRTCILPLSTLTWWHGGTSRVILPTGGEFQDPTGGSHPGRVPSPPFFLTFELRSPHLQPFLEPPGFFQCVPHSAESKGLSNWGDNNKDTSNYSNWEFTIIFHVNPITRSKSTAFRHHLPRTTILKACLHFTMLSFIKQADPDYLSNNFTIL